MTTAQRFPINGLGVELNDRDLWPCRIEAPEALVTMEQGEIVLLRDRTFHFNMPQDTTGIYVQVADLVRIEDAHSVWFKYRRSDGAQGYTVGERGGTLFYRLPS